MNYSISHIVRLAIPLILANCLVPLLGIVDTLILGHLAAPNALAGLGLGIVVFDFIFSIFYFLRMSTTGLVAQAIDDAEASCLTVLRGLALAIVMSGILIALTPVLADVFEFFMHTTAAVSRQALVFFKWNIWSTLPELVSYVIFGWLIALRQTRRAFYLMLIVFVVSVPLAVVFVYVLHMQVAGIGLSSVIALNVMMLVGLFWLWQYYRQVLKNIWHKFWQWPDIKRLMTLNGNVMLRTLALVLCYNFFSLQAAHYGPTILAADTLLLNMMYVLSYALDGFANVAESFVGQAIGEHLPLKAILRNTLLSALYLAIFGSACFALLGHWFITQLTDIASVEIAAKHYLPWLIIMPFFAFGTFWLDGVFIGATKGAEMRNSMIFSAGIFFVVWFVARSWQNHALWLALMIFFASRTLMQLWYMRRPGFLTVKA